MGQGWSKSKRRRVERDFYDFLSNCHIFSKDLGRICLGDHLYDGQRRFITTVFDALEEDIHDIYCLKSRQLGISTIVRAMIIFFEGILDGVQGAIVFDTDSNKVKARAELVTMINGLPMDLEFPGIKSDNRYELALSNGSNTLFMSAGVKKSKGSGVLGRSVGLSLAALSEICSYDNEEGLEAFENSLSDINPDRLYIWESPLALDTPIPTPSGWTTIGKVREGDRVYDERGRPCRVVGLSPIFINKKCYKITFSNGETIVADGAHKWRVMERRWPTNPQWKSKVVATEDIDISNHRIEVARPIGGKDIDLPIDPYFLGAWLGDGISGQSALVSGDDDMTEMRSILSERGCDLSPVSQNNWRVGKFTVLGQRAKFIDLKLLGNKHIPAIYLRASERQRRELLAGLMDTDGHISPETFRCEFANTSSRLVDDVAELLSSLGIKFNRSVLSVEGKLRKFPSGLTYACAASERLRFCENPEFKVFNLSRKRNIQNSSRGPRGYTYRKAKYLKIVSIEEVRSVPVRCISVDTPSHLFLVGKTMIPTHNTARGFNIWHTKWVAARADTTHKKCIFLGWWSKPSQSIAKTHPDFERYGTPPLTDLEIKKIKEVKDLYDHEITPEQLAWIRRRMDPNATTDGDAKADFSGDTFKLQEQPFTESDAFQMTGSVFFESEKLTEQVNKNVTPNFKTYMFSTGIEFTDMNVYPAPNARSVQLKVWEEPDPEGVYVVSGDVAYGLAERNDRSSVQVLRCYADGLDQVAEYAYPLIGTRAYAWVVLALAGWYAGDSADVYMIVEQNGPGIAVWDEITHLKSHIPMGYQPQAVAQKGLSDIFKNVRTYVSIRPDTMTGGKTWNWTTHAKGVQSKPRLMERCRDFTHNGMLRVRSLQAIEEMKSITRDGDSISAAGSKKDDRVMSIALGVRCWEDRVRRLMTARNRTRDNEIAKRKMTIVDLTRMFSQNQFQTFLAVKGAQRVNQQRSMSRHNWRHRERF